MRCIFHIGGLIQEGCNSSVLAIVEFHLFRIKPAIWQNNNMGDQYIRSIVANINKDILYATLCKKVQKYFQ